MDLDQLSNMKYAELQKLAKEKLNITKRLNKAKLIQSLMELNWISDDGTDKSADEEPTVEEIKVKPRRGQKRGKKSQESSAPENDSADNISPSKKKSKTDSLNATFSIEGTQPEESSNITEKEIITKEMKPKRSRIGRRCKQSSIHKEQDSTSYESETNTSQASQTSEDSMLNKTVNVSEPSEFRLQTESNDCKSTKVVAESSQEEPLKGTALAENKHTRGLKTPGFATSRMRRGSAVRELETKALTTPVANKKTGQCLSASKLKPRAVPNFAEIHQKQFEKMQSVDEYVEKKRHRTETLSASAVKRTARKASFGTVKVSSEIPKNRAGLTPTAASAPSAPASAKAKLNFNFVSGIQKPVFTAQGLVATEKKRLMATLKENHAAQGSLPASSVKSMKKSSMSGPKYDLMSNGGKQGSSGKQEMLKGVRVNRRFQLQMQHRNLKN